MRRKRREDPDARSVRFLFAELVENFHLTIAEIGELTEAQIVEIYLHPRDDKGNLIRPGAKRTAKQVAKDKRDAEPKSLDDALKRLEILNHAFNYRPEDYQRAREQLIKKWTEKHG